MTHIVRVGASPHFELVVWCSCSPRRLLTPANTPEVLSLDELSKIAHEHIESSERGSEADSVISGSRDYRAESLVTSEDQLVDLAAEGRSGAIGLG